MQERKRERKGREARRNTIQVPRNTFDRERERARGEREAERGRQREGGREREAERGRQGHLVLLEGKSSTEVGAETPLGVAIDLLPRGAVLEEALQGHVVALLPRRARVVHIAVRGCPV